MISELIPSQMCNTVTMTSWFSEVEIEALAHQFWGKSQLFLNDFAFPILHRFYDLYDRNDFPLVKNVRFSRDVEQQLWFPWISWKSYDVK